MEDNFQLLQRLPEELLEDVIQRLDHHSLKHLNRVSRQLYSFATPLLWRDVKLQDCRTTTEDADDHHDDTPLLQKLLILAKRKWIASCVQTLTHSCHLPPPALFFELCRTTFSGQTLSPDPRTAKLVQLAVENMHNVKTLRIIFGHPNINDVLLRCFFNANRPPSIRRLWLENCRISAGCSLKYVKNVSQLPVELDFTGLESIRFRRLPLRPAMSKSIDLLRSEYVHSRGDRITNMQDGVGGLYMTTTNSADRELRLNDRSCDTIEKTGSDKETITELFDLANRRDDQIYEALAEEQLLPAEVVAACIESHQERSKRAARGRRLDPDPSELLLENNYDQANQREIRPSAMVMTELLSSCRATLTCLCLDWVFTAGYRHDPVGWSRTFQDLFSLRFPNLRSFQCRNAIVPDTILPPDLYLLDGSKFYIPDRVVEEDGESTSNGSYQFQLWGLEFMEAHPNLQCLAWPMDRFFSGKPLPTNIAPRAEAVIDNLGRTLVDLRVDAMYSSVGEPQTESQNCPNVAARERRRFFIAEFASKMTKLESIKIEGGVPRDERREVLRALHKCPLQKIVMIGVSCPIGNTWGAFGRDLNETLDRAELELLEAEHKVAIHSLGFKNPEPPNEDFRFEPFYGWPPGPPMTHIITSLHGETMRELKICGYKGAPMLFTPTPITTPFLAPLKHLHSLESLIMSMWLNTEFEEAHRDSDIINYWLDSRSPLSTSLVRITDEEPEGWEKELRTKYAPDALAWWVTSYIGQFLSERAKAKKGGIHVRVSMCIGDRGGIFDIDLQIGKGSLNSDVCLSYKGPREELEPDRRREKLETRRWFY